MKSIVDLVQERYERAVEDMSKIMGQILWSEQLSVHNPRYHAQVYSIDVGWNPNEPDPFDEYAASVRRLNDLEESIQGS